MQVIEETYHSQHIRWCCHYDGMAPSPSAATLSPHYASFPSSLSVKNRSFPPRHGHATFRIATHSFSPWACPWIRCFWFESSRRRKLFTSNVSSIERQWTEPYKSTKLLRGWDAMRQHTQRCTHQVPQRSCWSNATSHTHLLSFHHRHPELSERCRWTSGLRKEKSWDNNRG